MGEMNVSTIAYEVIEKTVKPGGNSGRVYVPKSWINKRVKVLLLEPANSNTKSNASPNEQKSKTK